ncbi:helix-turn-helix domain-containing protein [Pseudooceanicola sp.]|uniref:helix-turn-helix domain-containing protein n=1 Tax=Pseudooceanicola sp. TaxID=1914328 RepID=UPI003514E57C
MPDAERRKLAVPDRLFHALSPEQHRKAKVTESIALAFFELEREGRVKRTSASIRAALPELKLKAAEYLAVPSEWDDSKIDKNTLRVPAKMSERTVRRHVSSYEKFGIAGLLGREAERGNRQARLSAETRALMAQMLTGYLDDSAPSMAQIHRNMVGRFKAENIRRAADGLPSLPCPSYESVHTAVKNLDPFQVAVVRDGFDAARNKFAPVGKGLDVTRPLQRVEMYEWKVDLMSVMAESGLLHHLTAEDQELLGLDGSKARWWLTVAIVHVQPFGIPPIQNFAFAK